MSLRIAAWICAPLAVSALLVGGCRRPAAQGSREVSAGTLVLRMPAKLGKMRRPPVEFDHDLHTAKVGSDCKTCHLTDRTRNLIPKFLRVTDGQSADKLMDHYHDRCLGCHKRRGKGARGCGECHAKRPPARRTWVSIHMDYSLHARHSLAFQKRCAQCHHVFDKKQQKLVYKKGTEEACAACHTDHARGRRPSLRQAAHQACVSCHVQRKGDKLNTGPVDCAGCHTRARQAKITTLPRPERLMRGQVDRLWVKAAGGKSLRVPFDHKGHEATASRCSTCHHQSLASCNKCHTLGGRKKGGRITLEQAYHDPAAPQSCVGCHRQASQNQACVGCHRSLKPQASRNSCGVCHSGPNPGVTPPKLTGPAPTRVAEPLPAYSKAFPEWVTIGGLAKAYAPSRMPHGKIVQKLHQLAGKSRLAVQFHGGVKALCAGCHHQAKPGARPTSCAGCHNRRGDATRDKPGLRAAYHRQCMGCHQAMGLARYNQCTSCHKTAPPKSSRGGKP